MSAGSGRLRRARRLWGLSLGLLLSGGVLVHALASSDLTELMFDAHVQVGRPVADAGDDFNATTGVPTTLDGSDSFDPNARLLTFHWRLQHAPRGSMATLADPTRPNPTFTPDVPGKYRFKLVVTNGSYDSRPAHLTVTAFAPGTAPPNARPGRDQSGFVGTPVLLDGSASNDPEGTPLAFLWFFAKIPHGSALTNADIAFSNTATPSFTPDINGRYYIALQVSDGALTDHAMVEVVVRPIVGPNADAGPDRLVEGLGPVTLDGRGSNDSDGRSSPLSYSWWLVARPPGSAVTPDTLQDAATATPTFTPDMVGAYVFRLQVSDGAQDDEDNVLIEVTPSINHPPVAQDDAAVTDENASVGIAVLGNDSDPDGDPLTMTGVTQGTNGGTVAINGVTVTYAPPADWSGADTFTYSISDGRSGTAAATVTVTVTPINHYPTVTMGADRVSGSLPLAVTFTATATDPDDDPLTYAWDFGDGTAKPTGSASESHTYQAAGSFTVTVTVSDGQATTQASLTITPSGVPDPSTVAPPLSQTSTTDLGSGTAFLYSGSNPIQTGVVPGTITPIRAAVLRGRVFNNLGTPLPGVVISILNHAEFGQTQTRSDGWFDLAVNGGGLLTVKYENVGYLPAQRQVQTPWQNFVVLPDVVMVPRDTQATTVDLTAPTPMQVAQGSVVTDADGTRQAALLIPQGTQAQVLLPDGSTQAVSTLTLRLTEYTVGPNGPKRMPAPLPPNSAYTYAIELGADEAIAKLGGKDVLFNQPVLFYVDNFLNFPVGIPVPTGYYDNSRGVWVPSDSGRIIKILSITGSLADLDTDGDGIADSGLGITEAERQQLASRYAAGTSLWRVPVSHLSTWDCNWGFSPPDDAQPYQGQTPQSDPQPNEPNQCEGSIVGCQDQTLGEALNLTGTPLSLSYKSDRVPGRRAAYSVDISLSGFSVPAGLTRIDLEVLVAGRLFAQAFPPDPSQRTTFTWDGLDAYGRQVQGSALATVRIGYGYGGIYQITNRFGYNGNGIPITGSRTRREVTLWQIDTVSIGGWDARGQGLGGWTLSAHHAYDAVGKVLYMGDGSRRSTNSVIHTITTVAGTGVAGFSGDGGPATQATIDWPEGVTVASDGSLYIADSGNARIRWVGPDGMITTVAGNGTRSFSGDGGPATQAALGGPSDVAVAPDGSIYIPDNNRIRRVGPDGIITTVAGTGAEGFSGDGGPATQATLRGPYGVTVASDGSLYIADTNNARIRQVAPDGIITTVAGTVNYGSSGDGGPATQAGLSQPLGVAVAHDGSLYIADTNNSRIRRVGPDGIITTVAGGGNPPDGVGDGGPATQARLYYPFDVAVAHDGSLYIADTYNNRIRQVGPDGIITTIAGTGVAGYGGDGGPAAGATLRAPWNVAVKPDGSLYIADAGSYRIRWVGPGLPGFAATDMAIPSEDGRELYQFDTNGRHLRTLHALTAATLYTFTYGSDGRLTQVTDGDGNVTTIQRDGSGAPTAVVAPFGQRTTLTLDSNGFLSSVTDPAGATTQLTSSSDGLLATLTDPKGNLHQFTYDSRGRLIKDQDPAAGFLALTRTEDLSTRTYSIAVTSALGRTSAFQVQQLATGDERRVNTDPAGLQRALLIKTDGSEQTTDPDGTTATQTDTGDPRWGMMAPVPTSLTVATPGGLTLTSTSTRTATLSDPTNPLSLTALDYTRVLNGRTSTRHFDAATRTFTDTSPAGRVVTRTIDSQGRTTSTKVTGLAAVNATYDAVGRLATVTTGTGPDARTTTLAYDAQSNLQSITDPLGRITSFTYDAVGRPLTQTLPDGRVIQTAYDANGNVASLTPPSRPAHTFDYTPIDLEQQYGAPPVSGGGTNRTITAYDAGKAPTTLTRPDGAAVALAYDAAGRPSTTTVSRGQVTDNYDVTTGNVSSLTAPDGISLAYTYDGALLTGTTWSRPVAGSVTRTYDTDFRVSGQSVNGANPISFGYDADSLLTSAGSLTIARNAQNGLLTGSTLSVVTDSRTYSTFGELGSYTANVSGSPVFATAYTRDKLGRITQKIETIGGVTTTFDYDYDLAGRLTQVKENSAVTASYTYDSNGNRLTGPGLTMPPTYDDQDRLLQYGPNAYAYTANGELATKTVGTNTTTYTYDELGNLTRVVLPGGTQLEYLIDGQNRRIGKKVGGVLTQGYLYDGSLRVIAELDGAGSLVSRFIYGSRSNVPNYMVKGGVTYRIIADHLGSPRLVVDVATGTVAQHLDYDEFGNVLTDTNPGFQPFGFAGGLYDPDTGLVRFGARDYDAETGRWTTKDPIRFGGGDTNLFSYVQNDPINWIDPNGLFQWHGNWGGPGWTAGQEQPEANLTPDDLSVPAIDARDACYKKHDICINKNSCNIKNCDYELASCLRRLSPFTRDFWITSRGYPVNALRESIGFDTFIPGILHAK